MLRRFSLAAFACAAVLVLPACDVFGGGDGDTDFFTQPSNSELNALEETFNCSSLSALDDDGSESGSLSGSDCTLADGSSADFYALDVTETTSVQITLRSDDFDAYLVVYDEDGTIVAQDDDGGGDTDARITRSMSSGIYVIAANSLDAGETGDYALNVEAND